MINGIRQKTMVREGGKVEVMSPELRVGATVEVIILTEPIQQDTTNYLLSTEANRKHLFQALKDLEKRENYIYVEPADL